MGRKSRRKWESRFPSSSAPKPVHPLAQAKKGMREGLVIGGALGVVLLLVGAVRVLFGGMDLEDENLLGMALLYVAGFAAGGAVGGALVPVRHRIGGHRMQGIAMAAVMLLVWHPILTSEMEATLGEFLIAWPIMSVVFGLMFGKFFADVGVEYAPAPGENLDPDFRSGRHEKFR